MVESTEVGITKKNPGWVGVTVRELKCMFAGVRAWLKIWKEICPLSPAVNVVVPACAKPGATKKMESAATAISFVLEIALVL